MFQGLVASFRLLEVLLASSRRAPAACPGGESESRSASTERQKSRPHPPEERGSAGHAGNQCPDCTDYKLLAGLLAREVCEAQMYYVHVVLKDELCLVEDEGLWKSPDLIVSFV